MRMTLPALLALIVLAGCDNNNDNDTGTPIEATPTTTKGELEPVTHHREAFAFGCDMGNCPRVELNWVSYAGQPALNDAIEAQLNALFLAETGEDDNADQDMEQRIETFLEEAASMPMANQQGWSLTASIEQLPQRDNLLTLIVEGYTYTGGAHGQPYLDYFHWNLATQQRLTLDDFLKPGQQDAFWELAKRQHEAWLSEQKLDQNFRDSWPFDKTQSFYLGEKGLVLQYNVYHIAPYAMGQPKLVIPYGELRGVVKAEYWPEALAP